MIDAADLALLEVRAFALRDPLAQGIIEALIAEVRRGQDEAEAAQDALVKAQDEASDAEIAIDHLKHTDFWKEIDPIGTKAGDYIGDVEDCLDQIRRLE